MTTASPLTMTLPRLDINQLIAELSSQIIPVPDRRGAERASAGRRENQRFQLAGLEAKAQRLGAGDSVTGKIEDVSSGGACLNSSAEFQPGDIINLHIRRNDGLYVPVQGEVRRKQAGAQGHCYGIRFLRNLPILLALCGSIGMMTCSDAEAAKATPVSSMQQQLDANSDYTRTLSFGGLERTYRFHVPKSYNADTAAPLVMVFHGNKETGESIQKYADLDKLSDKLDHGFITVYPDAVDNEWNIGAEDSDSKRNIDDVAFVLEIQKELGQLLNIDTSRIYASGISRGGLFAMKLGCELSDSIAAVTAVASTMREQSYHTDCTPTAAVPTAIIFGRDDPIMPYAGGEGKTLGTAVSVQDTVNFWADNNGCKTSQSQWLANKKNDNTEIAKIEYTDCEAGKSVVYYDIVGGGHTWPGSFGAFNKWLLGNTSQDINAAEVMWDFFSKQATTPS